jgi:hypothetical protein
MIKGSKSELKRLFVGCVDRQRPKQLRNWKSRKIMSVLDKPTGYASIEVQSASYIARGQHQ